MFKNPRKTHAADQNLATATTKSGPKRASGRRVSHLAKTRVYCSAHDRHCRECESIIGSVRSVQEGPQISDVIGTGHKVMVAETKDKRAVDVVFGCNRSGRYPV